MSTFKAGDEVTVTGSFHGLEFLSVARIGERKMVLSNGSEWSADGRRRWGVRQTRNYGDPYVRLRLPEDAEEIERQKVVRCIDQIIDRMACARGWKQLPIGLLKAVKDQLEVLVKESR